MPYFATILITFLLAVPAMSVELFRYRGAAMDGGTLEYIFETDEQDVPKTVSKEKAAEIAADFVSSFLSRADRRTRNARIPDAAGSVLARFLLRHDQRTDATNVFRRSPAGWDCC